MTATKIFKQHVQSPLQSEACGCSSGFSACSVVLLDKLSGDKDTPPRGAVRTQALLFTQTAECSWQGIQICQLSFCAVRMGQHHHPRIILTRTNTEVSLPPSTKYCNGADWRERKILFHQVMTKMLDISDKNLKVNTRTSCSC